MDGVQIDTDEPYTGVAPAQEAENLPTIEEIRQEMILRINEVRRENGVSELTVNQSLMDAAQKCSTMLDTSHKNKEECLTVIACGYPHGFNCNLTAFTGVGMHRIAEKAVTNWVNSPGHFETMVNADCDTLGVGVTIDNGRVFCYMMVGKRTCKWLNWLPDFDLIVVAKWILLVLLIVAALLAMGYGTAIVVSNIRNLFL